MTTSERTVLKEAKKNYKDLCKNPEKFIQTQNELLSKMTSTPNWGSVNFKDPIILN